MSVANNADARVSILKGPDYDVGCFANNRCVETPRTCSILATDGVTIFVGLNSRKFENVCKRKAFTYKSKSTID